MYSKRGNAMSQMLKSTDNATLRLLKGLDTIRERVAHEADVSQNIAELEELVRGRSLVRSELTGTLAAGLSEIPVPLDFRDITDETKENYRLFVKHAEHVS